MKKICSQHDCGKISRRYGLCNTHSGQEYVKRKGDTYKTWASMKQRCYTKSHKSYKDYGGRGITVCSRWMDYANFLEDMGIRPEMMSLDRINGNGNYEPSNCRWATIYQQAQNQKVKITNTSGFKGISPQNGGWIVRITRSGVRFPAKTFKTIGPAIVHRSLL